MTPMILWLSKEELDELTYQLVLNKNEKDIVLDSSELLSFTEKLIEENNKLLKLLLKLKPIDVKDVLAYQTHNKCDNIRQNIVKYYKGCTTRNQSIPIKAEEFLKCRDCDVTNDNEKYPTIEDLNSKYKDK
ncbi:MAG: hypothetical protein H6587_05860 [Flavobacteriales bacterium]|nr:hypothetical protein [Flavobacteriales bacterium]MCB9364076.1 hypothetical protein [Flavobacteriales bacterium]